MRILRRSAPQATQQADDASLGKVAAKGRKSEIVTANWERLTRSAARLTAQARGGVQNFARRFLDCDRLADRGASEMDSRAGCDRIHVVAGVEIHPNRPCRIDTGQLNPGAHCDLPPGDLRLAASRGAC